ncbi:MAG: exopolysaccharide biosynthesis protein, partial [Terrimicrobiaceae bacterium]
IILICGGLLLLPLPLPFSNALPALTVVLLAAGMLEKDGYFVIAGLLMFVITLIFFGSLFLGGAATVIWLKEQWSVLGGK